MSADDEWVRSVEERLAELHRLRQEVAELRAENARLRDRPADAPPAATTSSGVSRRGLFAAAAGAAGGMVLAQAAPAAAANGDPILAGKANTASVQTALTSTAVIALYSAATSSSGGTGVYGDAYTTDGFGFGVQGFSSSTLGTGVRGLCNAGTGSTRGVDGVVDSSSGIGVRGEATASSGVTYGVYGTVSSAAGFALFGAGRMKVTGRSFLATPNGAPSDSALDNGSVSFFLDQATNRLRVRVRYSNGTLKTGSIGLV